MNKNVQKTGDVKAELLESIKEPNEDAEHVTMLGSNK